MKDLGVGGWIAVLAIVFVLLFAISFIFMLCWNAGPAAVFGWPVISSWSKALCILVCAGLLFSPRNLSKQ